MPRGVMVSRDKLPRLSPGPREAVPVVRCAHSSRACDWRDFLPWLDWLVGRSEVETPRWRGA